MKNRLLAVVLALVMALTNLTPIAVSAAENDSQVLATDVSGGTFIDETADAGTTYEYTITGSDGSSRTVVVPAVTGDMGNAVTGPHTGSGEGVYYELVTDLSNGIPEGTYLLVVDNYSIAISDTYVGYNNSALSAKTVKIENNLINGEEIDLEWKVSGGNEGYYFQGNSEKYLCINGSGLLSDSKEDITTIFVKNTIMLQDIDSQFSDEVCLYYEVSGNCAYVTWVEDGMQPTCFSLYRKTEGTGSDYYKVDTTGLNELIEQYASLISKNYTEASWNAFAEALNTAKALQNITEQFETEEAAQAKLNEVNIAQANLITAYENLDQLETITTSLTWQRTLESNTTEYNEDTSVSQLVKGVEYISKADSEDANYSIITWKEHAEEILNLTTDPNMTVWDYNTDKQYAGGVGKVADVVAATWNEHENPNIDDGKWKNGSVRRFTAIFTWPAGYDVNDTAVYRSINDANYSAIYEYINNDPTLKERFGNSSVFPINDDMFVFIHKASETMTTDNYLDHMLFWSGTSGKGLWSTTTDKNDDSGRTKPPTFNGVSALPAYHGIMPNNNDSTGTQATVDGLSITTMQHTDDWYTLVNANVIMSTINNLYGVEDLSNQEMVIDVFCFDNSGVGGMDGIELVFQKTPETATSVQVHYYLDSILASNFLGSTVMTGVEDGTEITLHAGTNVNELDYYRFAAATKAGTVVSNGVQQDSVPYTVDIDKDDNIINVVYTPNDAEDRVYYFYDFGVKNTYTYTPVSDAVINQNYIITSVENSNTNIIVSPSNDKKTVNISYTPTNSLGEVVAGTLKIGFSDADDQSVKYETEVKPIVIAPASNVLFEENYMSQSTTTNYADWTKGGTVDATTVNDNEETVYGYTNSYKESTGESGTYTATVNGTTKFTDNLQFEFGGTGFDLIGTCGPNTGTISVRVVNSSGVAVKNYLVDTSFTDTTEVVGSGTKIYQVPLIQAQGLPEDTYTVTIRGAYIVYSSASAVSTYSRYGSESTGGTDPLADIYELLYGVGMTEDDIDSVEYINMGKLMGASTYAITEDTTEISETVTTPTEMIIEFEGFRSYRATDYNKYREAERGVTYQNILDCVSDGFAAYIENEEDGTYQVNNYEISGGPQNEIYLTSKNTDPSTAALAIGQANSVSKQISLRSVDGEEVVVKVNGGSGQNNGETITLKHTTEMYYEVPANDDGYIVVQVEEGFLGIGNLKLASGNATEAAVMPTALIEEDYAIIASAMRMYASVNTEDSEIETPKVEDSKTEKPKTETPDVEKPKADKTEISNVEDLKTETSGEETPETDKTEVPNVEGSKTEKPKTETSDVEKPKADKTETLDVEESTGTKDAELENRQETVEEEQAKDATSGEGVSLGVYVVVIILVVVGIAVVLGKRYQNKGGKR